MEDEDLDAVPEVKEVVSRRIERGKTANKVVEKSGHPDFPPVRSHRAQFRQWAQDRTVHSDKIGVIPFTFVDVIH